MERRDGGGAGAGDEDGRKLVVDRRAEDPSYRRAAPATSPARSYLGASSEAGGAGVRGPLHLKRCDDRCVSWVSASVTRKARRPYLARSAGTSNADVARPPDVVKSAPPPALGGQGAEPMKTAVLPPPDVARSAPPPALGGMAPAALTQGIDAPGVAPLSPGGTVVLVAPGQGGVVERRPRPASDTTVPLATPPLPDVAPPLGRTQWCSEPADPRVCRFGSHSDPGPTAAEADKGNQDFAFHLELRAPDSATWVLTGVADGVSQATWSARGARHAAGAFIEAFAELSARPDFPKGEGGLSGEAWSRALAQIFHRIVFGRLERDRDQLLAERHVDPTWTRELFEQTFWTGTDTVRETKKWFQSTLLATALGPHGGFALFLGDGYARVDRRMPSGAWESSPGLDPTRPVSFGLTEQEVFSGIERIGQKGAVELGVLVTTDGVSKSSEQGLARAMEGLGGVPGAASRPPLERFAPATSAECATFLRTLAALPAGLADVDNMSVAFASRALVAPGGS